MKLALRIVLGYVIQFLANMITFSNYLPISIAVLNVLLVQHPSFSEFVKTLIPSLDEEISKLTAGGSSPLFAQTFLKELKALDLTVEGVAEHTFEFITGKPELEAAVEVLHTKLNKSAADSNEKAWAELATRPFKNYTVEAEQEWLNSFHKALTCGVCRKAWTAFATNTPPNLTTRETYRTWVFEVYNEVQKANGKPVLELTSFDKKYPIPEKLLLKSSLSLGDIVMMTVAVRDLHNTHPGKYITDVETSCIDVWENNPYITKFNADDKKDARVINCNYPIIHESNQRPYHFVHGYVRDLAAQLDIKIEPMHFKGDIHLTEAEKTTYPISPVTPYWLIVAGGKYDFTVKWWELKRYQEVVDHFKGKVQFIQVGAQGHNHQVLKNVIDARGRTTIRQLIQLVYHANGVLCPITSLMHLAAAVPFKAPLNTRPCVVVAGGRESPGWAAYPQHQFLHKVGALPCCSNGGCWKARTFPIGDGTDQDKAICVNREGMLPKCMDMITSQDVIRSIESYYTGGLLKY